MASIEEDIDNSIQRIEKKQDEITETVLALEKKIGAFNKWAWVFVVLGLVIGLTGTIYFFWWKPESSNDFQFNLLGDFLSGAVTSIWSLAGLFFIYVAFLGQKQQLFHQQLEIMYSQLEVKNTRLELAGQKMEMRIQNSTLRQQKVENTFFNLLTLFNSIVNSIDIRNVRTQVVISSGRDCFKLFYDELIAIIIKDNEETENFNLQNISIYDTIVSYERFYNDNKADLSHYFRSIYHIIKFIDESEIEDKRRYVGLVRAQISSYEQIVIFYNCLHDYGAKFKVLAVRYNLFKNVDESLFINPDHIQELDE